MRPLCESAGVFAFQTPHQGANQVDNQAVNQVQSQVSAVSWVWSRTHKRDIFIYDRIVTAEGDGALIKSESHAREVQSRRDAKGLKGLAGAVKTWNRKQVMSDRIRPAKKRMGKGGPCRTPKGMTPTGMRLWLRDLKQQGEVNELVKELAEQGLTK
jgi:hypothetical protein